MAYNTGVVSNYFPSQAVSDLEKISFDYGLKIAKLQKLNGMVPQTEMLEQETKEEQIDTVVIKVISTSLDFTLEVSSLQKNTKMSFL